MDTDNEHREINNKLDTQRDIIRQSLNEIINEIGMAMRDVGLNFPVYITVRNSGDALVTIATSLDPSDAEWQQTSAIVCRTLEERVGCDRLRGRELALRYCERRVDKCRRRDCRLTEPLCHLQVPAEGIGKLNLPWRAALGLEQLRRTDQDRHALRPGRGDVEPVQAVEELHPTRRIGMAGRGRGVDRDGGFLSLELINSADAGTWQALLNFEDLRVVRRDNHDVVEREWLLLAIGVNPGRTASPASP